MKNFLKKPEIVDEKENIKKIFFYRVCGTGMGAAATLLKEAGFDVEGGDQDFYPPMSTYLESSNISLKKISDCTDEYLREFDLIIVGNVVPRNSDDAKRLESLGTHLTSFPQALGGLLLSHKKVVGVAGTHGKTTTTYIGAQVFEQLGAKPGYFIGGVLPDGPSAKLGEGELFFIESDEYDTAYFEKTSKFLHYDINHLILTSLEFDHADIFEDPGAILKSFEGLFETNLEKKIIFSDDEMTKVLLEKFSADLTYGEGDDFGPNDVKEFEEGTSFHIGGSQYETNLKGSHNILNLTSIVSLALELGFGAKDINGAIKNLKLVKRRQELKGHFKGALVFDDFAHHPTAIEKTLAGMETRFPDKKIVAIFEPASSTARSNLFQDRFPASFKSASKIIILKPARKTTVFSADDLNLKLLKDDLIKLGKEVSISENLDELTDQMNKSINSNCLAITLSNAKIFGLFGSNLIQDV